MLTRRPNTSGMDPEKTTGILAAQQDLVSTLQSRMPGLLAIYAFGSRVQGTAVPQSDLDLAVLVAGYADPVVLWELSGELADLAGCPVELLDLRAASTVMQHQIITTGHRWRANDRQAALADGLKRMGEFRIIAMHDSLSLQFAITVAIITRHLDEFLQRSQALLLRDTARPSG